MPKLTEIQSHFRNAVVYGDVQQITPLLYGGCYPERRLAVHQRNYETSLIDALLVKFPATGWLAGTPFLTDAASRFIRRHPPNAPCIAEYGTTFPAFLSSCKGIKRMPYLREFAELEWHIGQAAIAVNRMPASPEQFLAIGSEAVPDTTLTLQQGLHYLHAAWPVDELMNLYLTETTPEQFCLSPADVWIEVRGARGEFHFSRVNAADFLFRRSVLEGQSVGDAAERALDTDANFDPGQALGRLIAAGLITAIARKTHDGS
jgi:hypothetical protein